MLINKDKSVSAPLMNSIISNRINKKVNEAKAKIARLKNENRQAVNTPAQKKKILTNLQSDTDDTLTSPTASSYFTTTPSNVTINTVKSSKNIQKTIWPPPNPRRYRP